MDDRACIATRKGLFELRRKSAGWAVETSHFLGEPVSLLLPPDGSGRMLAALNLGHFGVKLQRPDDAGASWQELAAPAYPAKPADAAGPAWKLVQIWSLEERGGSVWAGTHPGGLFRSDDGGDSWELVEALWNRPERGDGSAAATTRPASTRSARTRATSASCCSASAAAASG